MLYESLVLTAWGKHFRREDSLQLGNADIFRVLNNELNDRNGHDAKFGLSAAVKKVAIEKEGAAVHEMLIDLDNKVWVGITYNELSHILPKGESYI